MIHWYIRKSAQWLLMAGFTLWAVMAFFENDWFKMGAAILIIIGSAMEWYTDNKEYYLECEDK